MKKPPLGCDDPEAAQAKPLDVDVACLHFTKKRAVRKDGNHIFSQVAAYAASLLY